jgi:hypothetical protein
LFPSVRICLRHPPHAPWRGFLAQHRTKFFNGSKA